MDIVYFGSDVFMSCFEYLAERHNILALYTYHNNEDYITEFSVTRRARELGIPVRYEAVSPETTRQFFKNGCSLYFVAEYDRIIDIPEDLPYFRGINIHSSALPEGRSYYPIEAAMERGLTRTGVTMHELKPRLDSGPILAQRLFDVTADMDSIDVYLRCGAYAAEMTEELFRDFEAEWAGERAQEARLPYWKRPDDEKLTLRHGMDRAEAAGVFRRSNSMT
ncbi:MAG: hypothetical protein J5827_03740, partial [Oscillospiraceae bacterium]|nr:hypothetical protein [Oscillospiraceae bacterium]